MQTNRNHSNPEILILSGVNNLIGNLFRMLLIHDPLNIRIQEEGGDLGHDCSLRSDSRDSSSYHIKHDFFLCSKMKFTIGKVRLKQGIARQRTTNCRATQLVPLYSEERTRQRTTNCRVRSTHLTRNQFTSTHHHAPYRELESPILQVPSLIMGTSNVMGNLF